MSTIEIEFDSNFERSSYITHCTAAGMMRNFIYETKQWDALVLAHSFLVFITYFLNFCVGFLDASSTCSSKTSNRIYRINIIECDTKRNIVLALQFLLGQPMPTCIGSKLYKISRIELVGKICMANKNPWY